MGRHPAKLLIQEAQVSRGLVAGVTRGEFHVCWRQNRKMKVDQMLMLNTEFELHHAQVTCTLARLASTILDLDAQAFSKKLESFTAYFLSVVMVV